jgi:NitT/TauT family transport system permease protein
VSVVDAAALTSAPDIPAAGKNRLHAGLWLPPLVFGVALLLIWEVACSAGGVPEYLLPAPSAIWDALVSNIDLVWSSTRVSGLNAIVGLLLGTVIGVVAAMGSVWFRPFDAILGPIATAAAAIPIVATAPVFYGMYSATQEMPRILTVALVVFFPVYVSCARGLRNITPVHADLMRSYAVSAWAVTATVRIPGAIGYFFTGLRVAGPSAVIAEIVAEYFGGLQNGIGYRITSAAAATAYPTAWSYVVAAIVLGLLFFLVVLTAEHFANRRFTPTKRK